MTAEQVPGSRDFTITLNPQELIQLRRALMRTGCRYSPVCNYREEDGHCQDFKSLEVFADRIMDQIESQLTNIHGVDWID